MMWFKKVIEDNRKYKNCEFYGENDLRKIKNLDLRSDEVIKQEQERIDFLLNIKSLIEEAEYEL